MIRPATRGDLPSILSIYTAARKFMEETGNASQWNDSYPPVSLVEEDIKKNQLYVITTDTGAQDTVPNDPAPLSDTVHAVFAFLPGEEPDYDVITDGHWLSDTPYRAVHRVASDGTIRGVVSQCMDYCKSQCSHLRIDTHKNNLVMQHQLEKNGFRRCGIIHIADGSPRIAYEYDSSGLY